jgi:hypothetical protein
MQQALYDKGYGQQRPRWKVRLYANAKAQRVTLLKKYHPDNFNWRNVVFTHETPAKVGDRRGMQRSWAIKDEAYHPDVKRPRVKRQSEGQVWACFVYGRKGQLKFWHTEEEEEKKAAKLALQEENEVRKAAIVLEQMSMLKEGKKVKLMKKERKPKEATLYKRNSCDRGGMDGYRHREEVPKPLPTPLAEELEKERRNVFVLEDSAPAHRSDMDNQFYKMSDVAKLLWPPNSPDANAIEQAWPWLRRHVTKDFPPSTTIEECERSPSSKQMPG